MPADYRRIHRLLKILTLIQGQPGWTAERLAAECQVTVRTIYRDMKMLEGAGIPYFHDTEQKGYGVRRDFFMPPVQLTLDESLAMIALVEHIGGKEQIPLTRAAGKAIAKVRSVLPQKLQQDLEQIDRHVAIKLAQAGPYEGISDVYEAMRSAIVKRRVLQCKYESVNRGGTSKSNGPFLFKPYTLLFSQRAWYVLGHHGKHDAVRCLKLNRFSAIQPTKERYEIPAGFSVDKHVGQAWRMIRGKKRYEVELGFDAEFAETIADTLWHPTQQVEWHEDESITFTCQVDGLEEIVWWVLSMGPHCVVRKPAELAEQVKSLAGGILANYEAGAKSRRKSRSA